MLTRSTSAEVDFRLLRELLREQMEQVEVGLGLPRRVDRRAEGVHERVHVRRTQVVFLVPGGRRQDDVREQRGARHPEVCGQQQVELALRCFVVPSDPGRVRGLRVLGAEHIVVCAEQVTQEVLVAFGR